MYSGPVWCVEYMTQMWCATRDTPHGRPWWPICVHVHRAVTVWCASGDKHLCHVLGAVNVWCVPGGYHLCHVLGAVTVWCVPGGTTSMSCTGGRDRVVCPWWLPSVSCTRGRDRVVCPWWLHLCHVLGATVWCVPGTHHVLGAVTVWCVPEYMTRVVFPLVETPHCVMYSGP